MASFSYGGAPPPSHSGLRHYPTVHRPGLLPATAACTRGGAELLRRQSRATTPRTKLAEKMVREKLLMGLPPPSSYDTAWLAMVPAPGSARASRFPQCVEWIMQNQRSDGSWGLQGRQGDDPSLLIKDALSSTLACVLALKTWGVGDEHVGKGLRFIGHNLSSVTTDGDVGSRPVGFNVIFPGMLARCIGMGVEMPLAPADVDGIFRLRDKELPRWLDVDFVPAMYPRILYARLRMVDALEKTGISRSFSSEINGILDMTYAYASCPGLANDEEIMLDMTTCAMAFRLLRMHGYDVSSDASLGQFSEESSFHDSIQGCLGDTEALLELHKASQVQIREQETAILRSIGSWSAKLLEQQLRSNKVSRNIDPAEVDYALKHPFYTTLDRLEHRRNIEHFKTTAIQVLKSAYR
ncbi:hypothetical protein Zm00014a_036415 [Zea mays]|uniref:Terpene synthase N-terminal domain-containing protein n=1 Tax=Zea mays TaxID=4577 RepID=A0A3L6EXD1_MAIZE|nr:hypothetical protein Zm00014a_036415 [Zea mays]